MAKTLVTREGELTADEAMRFSRGALDRSLEGDAELAVIEITTEAFVVGAFQRHHGLPDDVPLTRRISGGPYVRVGPGTLHVVLALAHPSALVACDARKLVNRHVRPLLHALTRSGALSHYLGRDWISVGHRPVGQVGFAHDGGTRRAVFEAFVAVSHEFAPRGRASFRGKEPGTVESVTGHAVDRATLRARILGAYAAESGSLAISRTFEPESSEPAEGWEDPPWTAAIEDAIGEVAAGRNRRGALRLGGDLLASRDAVDRVSAAVDTLPEGATADDIGAAVDREFSSASVALDGVRDLKNLRDVLLRAR